MTPRSDSEVLTSLANPTIKRVRSLQQRKFRTQERAFVVEGVRAVEDVLAACIIPHALYVSLGSEYSVTGDMDAPVRYVNADVFRQLTDVAHPQGVLAVVPMLDESELPAISSSPLVVVLDAIRDPGNMGTLFRSAAGAGVDHLIIGAECVDPYNPKVVRSAMGAHFRVPFSRHDIGQLSDWFEEFPLVALADAGGNALYDSVRWQNASVMIIGGEAFGPSNDARQIANTVVSIPLLNGVESLNAGVAGSLLMFEAARQRRI
ncbi:MAG: RNA methyltransferase [Thermomicrobiales bacterium]|nr:RNA methyltransferase [Thermomicrobiales bacterium]